MHSKSAWFMSIEFMIYDNTDEVIEDLLESLFNRYQIGLQTSMRGSNSIFDCVYLLCSNVIK